MHALVLCKLHDIRRQRQPPDAVVETMSMLSSTSALFDTHKKAVAIIAKSMGLRQLGDAIDRGNLEASIDDIALRDEALQNAYELVIRQMDAAEVDDWMRKACLLHLKVIDVVRDDASDVPPGWLGRDAFVRRGSEALADAVEMYQGIRRLIPQAQPWVDAIAEAPGVGGAMPECSDVEAWLPGLQRRRTKLVQARDNDTMGRLCFRYGATSANDLRTLNPELVADGFGHRPDARLRRGTQVCVYCSDSDDDGHDNDNDE